MWMGEGRNHWEGLRLAVYLAQELEKTCFFAFI